MARGGRLRRRDFLRLGVVATGSAALPGTRPVGRARWRVERAFPDRPVPLRVELPDAPERLTLPVTLRIETPLEELRRDVGEVVLSGGCGELVVPLHYPYEDRVSGRFRYHAEVSWRGRRVVTGRPATYGVRPVVWLS